MVQSSSLPEDVTALHVGNYCNKSDEPFPCIPTPVHTDIVPQIHREDDKTVPTYLVPGIFTAGRDHITFRITLRKRCPHWDPVASEVFLPSICSLGSVTPGSLKPSTAPYACSQRSVELHPTCDSVQLLCLGR